uniref:Transposase n=1 Tax=Brugia timori TaxID=42155 RepID=A0A0R3R761_9BILA
LPTVHFIYSKQSRTIVKYHLYHWLQLKMGHLEINPSSKVCWNARNNVNVATVA